MTTYPKNYRPTVDEIDRTGGVGGLAIGLAALHGCEFVGQVSEYEPYITFWYPNGLSGGWRTKERAAIAYCLWNNIELKLPEGVTS